MKGFQGKEGDKLEKKRAMSPKRQNAKKRKDRRDIPINEIRVAAGVASGRAATSNSKSTEAAINSNQAAINNDTSLGYMNQFNSVYPTAVSNTTLASSQVTGVQIFLAANYSPQNHGPHSMPRARSLRAEVEEANSVKDLGRALASLVGGAR